MEGWRGKIDGSRLQEARDERDARIPRTGFFWLARTAFGAGSGWAEAAPLFIRLWDLEKLRPATCLYRVFTLLFKDFS
jgi:hypothetical protein